MQNMFAIFLFWNTTFDFIKNIQKLLFHSTKLCLIFGISNHQEKVVLSKFLLFKFFYFPKKIEKCRWIYKTQNIFPENCWYVFLSQITPVSQEKGPHDRKADKKVLSYCEFDESCFCATMLITFVYRTEYIYICAIQAVRECRS